MSSVNRVILLGNLGADPEQFGDNNQVTKFRVATSMKWTDKNGERQEATEWHKVVTFGSLAENCFKNLRKGSQVYLEGSLQTTQYEKDGEKRYSTEVKAQTIQFLSNWGEERTEGKTEGFNRPKVKNYADDIQPEADGF